MYEKSYNKDTPESYAPMEVYDDFNALLDSIARQILSPLGLYKKKHPKLILKWRREMLKEHPDPEKLAIYLSDLHDTQK